MPGKKIFDNRHVKENNANDDEEILKNNPDFQEEQVPTEPEEGMKGTGKPPEKKEDRDVVE